MRAEPLTPDAFRPFGQVIAADPAGPAVNDGSARRHEALPALDLQRDGGRAVLAVYDARARACPFEARVLERHRGSAQVFVPMGGRRRCLLLVAPAALHAPGIGDCRLFVSDGVQGVSLDAGTWHHGLLALDDGPWVVLERRGAEIDCEEHALDHALWLQP